MKNNADFPLGVWVAWCAICDKPSLGILNCECRARHSNRMVWMDPNILAIGDEEEVTLTVGCASCFLGGALLTSCDKRYALDKERECWMPRGTLWIDDEQSDEK